SRLGPALTPGPAVSKRNVCTDQSKDLLAPADRDLAEIPASIGGQRQGDVREPQAAQGIAVAVHLRNEQWQWRARSSIFQQQPVYSARSRRDFFRRAETRHVRKCDVGGAHECAVL